MRDIDLSHGKHCEGESICLREGVLGRVLTLAANAFGAEIKGCMYVYTPGHNLIHGCCNIFAYWP